MSITVDDHEGFVKPVQVFGVLNNQDMEGAVPSRPSVGVPPADGPGVGAVIAASLRRERERAGLSLGELARRAGVAKSTLSQLESGGGNPNIETLWALATALGVTFSRLVESPAPAVRVVRAGEGPALRSSMADFAATTLTTFRPGIRGGLYILELEPGSARQAEPHQAGTQEHVVVATGRLRVGPVDAPVTLGAGDYAVFPADGPHVYEALRKGTRVTLLMDHT